MHIVRVESQSSEIMSSFIPKAAFNYAASVAASVAYQLRKLGFYTNRTVEIVRNEKTIRYDAFRGVDHVLIEAY